MEISTAAIPTSTTKNNMSDTTTTATITTNQATNIISSPNSNDNDLQSQMQPTNITCTNIIKLSNANELKLNSQPPSDASSTTAINNHCANETRSPHLVKKANTNCDSIMAQSDEDEEDANKSRDNFRRPPDNNQQLIENNNIELLRIDIKKLLENIINRIESSEQQHQTPIHEQQNQLQKKKQPQLDVTATINTTIIASQTSTASESNDDLNNVSTLVNATLTTNPIIEDDDDDYDKPKDIVTLRNLEITPPPPPPAEELESNIGDEEEPERSSSNSRNNKRTHSESTELSDESMSGGRSKRLRRQTKLFQVEEAKKPVKTAKASKVQTEKPTSSRKRTTSTKKQAPIPPQPQISQELQDVIFYEKNDYLAIRNEENSFYLCQLAENVRVQKPLIKVKWLDTADDGKTYFLTAHYDKVPQKSIIMPVILNQLKTGKKSEQLFSLDDEHKESVMDRLRRSLNVTTEGEL